MTPDATIDKINDRDDRTNGTSVAASADDRVPFEASAAQRSAARELFGLFQALQQQGFTEDQALVLVGKLLTSTVVPTDDDKSG